MIHTLTTTAPIPSEASGPRELEPPAGLGYARCWHVALILGRWSVRVQIPHPWRWQHVRDGEYVPRGVITFIDPIDLIPRVMRREGRVKVLDLLRLVRVAFRHREVL